MLSDFLFSLRIYGNPYASTGTCGNFCEVADASTRSLDKRYVILTDNQVAANKLLPKNGVTSLYYSEPPGLISVNFGLVKRFSRFVKYALNLF